MVLHRQITLSAHGTLELLLALLTAIAPFALGLAAGPAVAVLVVAALLATVAIDGGIVDERGLPAISPLGHRGFDALLVVLIALTAVGSAISAGLAAGLALLAIAAAELALALLTRYQAP